MPDSNHSGPGSHTGVLGCVFFSPAVLFHQLSVRIPTLVLFSWKMPNMRCMLGCQSWGFFEESEICTLTDVLRIGILKQILCQLYHEITPHHCYIYTTRHFYIDRYCKGWIQILFFKKTLFSTSVLWTKCNNQTKQRTKDAWIFSFMQITNKSIVLINSVFFFFLNLNKFYLICLGKIFKYGHFFLYFARAETIK